MGILSSILITNLTAKNLHLGDLGSKITWVYLCGLTEDYNSPQEVENRSVLDRIGKRKGIRFLALHPFDRCSKANNKLCWINYTPEQTENTFTQIMDATKAISTAGYIGFSNGGFFLNEIAQMRELGVPIISIGAAGTYRTANCFNNLTLIVGKQESIYNDALELAQKSKGSPLTIKFIEHSGDHILPEQEVEQAIIRPF